MTAEAGNWVEVICGALMYNQADLARETGMTPNTISDLKKKNRPTKAQKELLKWAIWKRISYVPNFWD